MKTFRAHISEAQALFNTRSMIFVNYETPALILSPTMIDRIFGQKRVDAWHVTDLDGLKGLKRIEGKKSSISVLTEIEPGRVRIFTMGVETGGGYCVSLEGNLLLSADFDVYSERLESGRRAITVIKMQDKMWNKYGEKGKLDAGQDFNKLGNSLDQKQKGQFIKEWIDNCEAILKKNKKAQEELRKIGRHELSTYNESVVNQIKIKRVYVINDNKLERFGTRYKLAKEMFKDVLEVTSKRMGEIIK